MSLLKLIPILCTSALAGNLLAQSIPAPILTAAPHIPYPPIAKAARVEGEVVVSFSIDSDGRTVSVQALSGPPMLIPAVYEAVKQWRFQTPLPMNTEEDFKATYKFSLHREENLEDDLDAPPYIPCCGDAIYLPAMAGQVSGEVRSLDGTLNIDVTPAPAASQDRCPDEKEKSPPSTSAAEDFVELYRRDYRVRVYRNGHIEWHGTKEVAVMGDSGAQISSDATAALLARFQTQTYWSACSIQLPRSEQDVDESSASIEYFTVSVGGHQKSVCVSCFSPQDIGERFAWAVDKTADTHRWRHGDSASESYANMFDDLVLPKPGITALMRATHRFNFNAEQTLEPLKLYIARGVPIDAVDESGWTALMYAAQLSFYDDHAIQLLLDAHADVNHASLHGDTALMMGAFHGVLIESLVERGADINMSNADGVTALMLLAQYDRPDILKKAILAGADATLRDNAGHTALDYLRAASCLKPIIALPKTEMQIIYEAPVSCPSKRQEFLQSQALLQAAMKMSSSR